MSYISKGVSSVSTIVGKDSRVVVMGVASELRAVESGSAVGDTSTARKSYLKGRHIMQLCQARLWEDKQNELFFN